MARDAEAVARLRRVLSRLARQLNTEAAGEGLTPSQASVLAQIVTHGPLASRELGPIEGLDPTSRSGGIGKLYDARLIRRRPNPEDLRSAQVESTRAGVRLSERIRARRTATLSAGVANLSARLAQALVSALPALEALAADLQQRSRSEY